MKNWLGQDLREKDIVIHANDDYSKVGVILELGYDHRSVESARVDWKLAPGRKNKPQPLFKSLHPGWTHVWRLIRVDRHDLPVLDSFYSMKPTQREV